MYDDPDERRGEGGAEEEVEEFLEQKKEKKLKEEIKDKVRIKYPLPENSGDSRVVVKNVTIRGIDAKTYDEFSRAMKVLDMTMGDAITKMMNDVIKDFDETFPDLSSRTFRKEVIQQNITIMEQESLSVGAKDLVDANAKITFINVDFLEFEPDVTRELFLRHVSRIMDCENVRMPAVLPKLLVIAKISNCDQLEIYDVTEQE